MNRPHIPRILFATKRTILHVCQILAASFCKSANSAVDDAARSAQLACIIATVVKLGIESMPSAIKSKLSARGKGPLHKVVMLHRSVIFKRYLNNEGTLDILHMGEGVLIQIEGIAIEVFGMINGKLTMFECLEAVVGADQTSAFTKDMEKFLEDLLKHKIIFFAE